MKKLPIGIEDFSVCSKIFYIDKTLLIKDIIDYFYGKSILISRPKRFGKSLNLSMVEYFFSIQKNSKDLFFDKKICKEDTFYIDEMNAYPVIHLNMKNIKTDNYESLKNKLIDIISLEYRKFNILLDSNKLLEIEKKEYLDIVSKKTNDIHEYTLSIYKLSILLYKHYGKKVIILIDEYDSVIEDSYNKGFYTETIALFREFYSSFLKGNEYMQFAILTGVLQMAKESIFSDLNNLDVYSVDKHDLTEYFGFTKEDVLTIISSFNLNFDINQISDWYGGYGCGNIEIFNPWSILNLVENEKFGYYWTNTGSNENVSNLIRIVDNSYFLLNELINNDSKSISFNNSISYKDITYSIETIVSYLIQSGYLVISSKESQSLYKVKIPNLEIEKTFENEIITRNFNKPMLEIAVKLKYAIETGKPEQIKEILNTYILTSFSYYDLKNEKEYQAMLTGILAVLFNEYLVRSEVNSKNGRCDIMIYTKNTKERGFVIEIKYSKGILSQSKLKNSSLVAINQIRKKDYFNELSALNIKERYLYGIAFDDKHVEVSFDTF